jgi:hypothetical protein
MNGQITLKFVVWTLVPFVVMMCLGCDARPSILIPIELTPGMSLFLNEHVDSSLKSGLFTKEYVPSGLPFGIKSSPRLVYYDTNDVIQRSIKLGAHQQDRRLRGVELTWFSHEGISPNPRIDSLSFRILSLLRKTYNKPFELVELNPYWYDVEQVVSENMKIRVTIRKRESMYECMVYINVS